MGSVRRAGCDPSVMTAPHNRFPDKAIYFTECSGSQSSNPADTFSGFGR